MRAAFYRSYGNAREVLEVGTLPKPEPGPGEVSVRVAFSGVNPSDTNRRRGIRQRLENTLIVPHNDGSGIIESIGEGVDKARIGERVWLWNGQRDGRTMGTCSQYFTGPEKYAVPLPAIVSLEEGACLGVPAVTAYTSLFEEGPLDGSDVLVTGAAGAVGHYAAQMARLAGAGQVFGTVSGDAKGEHAAKTGIDHVLNYRRDNVAEHILRATGGKGVERISEVNFFENLPTIAEVAGSRCAVGVYGSGSMTEGSVDILPFIFRHVSLRFIQCNIVPKSLRDAGTRDINRWAASGSLIHTIGKIFDLNQIAEAHEAVEGRQVTGNVLVKL